MNRTKVVCPVIDIISDDSFGYVKSFELHWGAFNWQLHFRWYLIGSRELKMHKLNIAEPFATPAMAGGLFSIDRNYFYEIGAYDDNMKVIKRLCTHMIFRFQTYFALAFIQLGQNFKFYFSNNTI